ncbi:MAG: alpha/beta hydrolase [Allosphingosinicella sp.]|uniref:alpha/beta hydrolase n=1 Tax=Allosphingosinicella sp. TaxID=2823234 RepID=UPI0039331EAE
MLRWLLLALSMLLPAAAAHAQSAEPIELTVAADMIAGRLYEAPDGSGAVVLMLGGSDGGYPSRRAAQDLAASGYPTLALAYFSGFSGRVAGLPDRLEEIPLAYFGRPLAWMRARFPRRPIVLMGESRGAELALLLASRHRDIAGIVAFSPSSLVWGAVGDASGRRAAWQDARGPVPYAASEPQPGPSAFAAALADPAQRRRAAIPSSGSLARSCWCRAARTTSGRQRAWRIRLPSACGGRASGMRLQTFNMRMPATS